MCAGAFADGTALGAAAAESGFFSPLSGALLAPLQQRQLGTPDLSPHARRRQLHTEQQVRVGVLMLDWGATPLHHAPWAQPVMSSGRPCTALQSGLMYFACSATAQTLPLQSCRQRTACQLADVAVAAAGAAGAGAQPQPGAGTLQ
jgi:hypothetical protein